MFHLQYLDVKAYTLSFAHLEEDTIVHHGEVGMKQPSADHSIATGLSVATGQRGLQRETEKEN